MKAICQMILLVFSECNLCCHRITEFSRLEETSKSSSPTSDLKVKSHQNGKRSEILLRHPVYQTKNAGFLPQSHSRAGQPILITVRAFTRPHLTQRCPVQIFKHNIINTTPKAPKKQVHHQKSRRATGKEPTWEDATTTAENASTVLIIILKPSLPKYVFFYFIFFNRRSIRARRRHSVQLSAPSPAKPQGALCAPTSAAPGNDISSARGRRANTNNSY